jgi:hypothetical protein
MAPSVIPSGFVGCDVGKSEIVVYDATSLKTSKVANTRKDLAAFAPHPRQSGASNAYRSTRGGRTEVKRAVFMPAQVAAKHNPDLKPYFQRLVQNGKKPIVAITAVMRKLVVIAKSLSRRRTRFKRASSSELMTLNSIA